MQPASLLKKYIDQGLNVIGISDKRPAEGTWKEWQSKMREPQNVKGTGLAIICGAVSGNLEVLDIDLKYDNTGTLYERLKQKINTINSQLINSMLIIKTPSGGYHWFYRCADGVEKNQKLAMRPPTEEEQKGRETQLVLLETRGEAGYVASLPTKGYEHIQGSYSKIPSISAEDRDLILSSAREFNEIIEEAIVPTSSLKHTFNITKDSTAKTPWEDYNERASIPEILQDAGWSFVSEDSEREYWKRPGKSSQLHSGNYLKSLNCFKTFSSSTILEPEKAYYPFALYAMLIHNGSFTAAARELRARSYGDQNLDYKESVIEYAENRLLEKPIAEQVHDVDIAEYLADEESDYAYLQSVRNNSVKKGLSTGSTYIDEYLLFKPATYTVAIGHTSVGKSLSILWITMLACLKHDWKCIVIAKENSSADFKEKLAEFYLQKPLQHSTTEEFEEAYNWVSDHYRFVKGRGGKVRTMTDALKLMYSLADEGKYDLAFLDPYSGFDQDKKAGESAHEMDTRFNSELLDFTEKTGISVILSVHTVTSSRREKTEDGLMKRPHLDSGSGGATFSNRPDSVWVIHRIINHEDPTERCTTELYIDKDRNLHMGGRISPIADPIKLQLRNNRFYVHGSEDVIYKIKNAGRSNPEENNITIKFDEDLPF